MIVNATNRLGRLAIALHCALFFSILGISNSADAQVDSLCASMTVTINHVNSLTNLTCNGSASVVVNGGHFPFTYHWNTNVQTSSISNLCPGSYTLMVTDTTGCQKTATVTIVADTVVQNPCINLAVVMNHVNSTTNLTCNGSATASANGGKYPYLYHWNNNVNGSSINSLCPGNFTVTVTDSNGCQKTAVAAIAADSMVNPCMNLNLTVTHVNSLSNISCNGSASGIANGGTVPYFYHWNTNANTSSLNGLCPGNYTLTVTDTNGCQKTAVATIAADTTVVNPCANMTVALNKTNSVTNQTCNGSATATANGGHFPYMYHWNTNASTSSISNLCPGNYTVTVTDSGGCQKTAVAAITADTTISPCANLNLTVTHVNSTLNVVCNGSASVTANGGTFPYSYHWSNNVTGSSVSSLCIGNFTVTVTDSIGCQKTAVTTIAADSTVINCANLNVTFTHVNSTTNLSCNGSATATANGGTYPYSYVWTNTTGPSVNGLCPGNYLVTVRDSNGCQKSATVTIAADTTLSPCANLGITLSHLNASTSSSCNGSASSVVTGGVAPYIYSWSSGATSSSVSALCVGNYTLTVRDSNNCSKAGSITIGTDSSCNGFTVSITGSSRVQTCVGQASAHVNGGTAPFHYSWSNYYNLPAISNLCPGVYQVVVTDNKGCGAISSITIAADTTVAPIPLNLYVHSTDATTVLGCDGTAALTVTGGKAPFVYAYSNGATTAAVNSLCPGVYSALVTDNNGVKDSIRFIISSAAAVFNDTTNHAFADSVVVATVQSTAVQNCTINYNTVDSVTIGSYFVYKIDSLSVTWNVYSSGSTTPTPVVNTYGIGGNGVYTVVFQLYCDGNVIRTNAPASTGFIKAIGQVNILPVVTGIANYENQSTEFYPVPFKDQLTVKLSGNGTRKLVVYDVCGKQVSAPFLLPDGGIYNLNLSNLVPGCYLMKITSDTKEEYRKILKN